MKEFIRVSYPYLSNMSTVKSTLLCDIKNVEKVLRALILRKFDLFSRILLCVSVKRFIGANQNLI